MSFNLRILIYYFCHPGILLMLFGLAYLTINWEVFWFSCAEMGDLALIELGAHKASHLEAFLGPYSRFGFNHPGPISSYFYAAGGFLFSWIPSETGRVYLTQAVLNLLWLGVALSCLLKGSSRPDIKLGGITAVAIITLSLPPGTLSWPWGPDTLPFAELAMILSLVATYSGYVSGLYVFILSGSFLAQTHLSMLVPVASFSVLSIATHLWRCRVRWIDILLAPLLAVILWLPVIYEFFVRGVDSNVFRLFRFISGARARHSIDEILIATDRYFGLDGLSFFLLFAALALSLTLSILKKEWLWALLSGLIILRGLQILLSFPFIKGPLHEYLLFSIISFLALFSIVTINHLGYLQYRYKPVLYSLLSLAIFLHLLFSTRVSPLPCSKDLLSDFARAESPFAGEYQFEWRGNSAFPISAKVLLELYRLNIRVCLPRRLKHFSGDLQSCEAGNALPRLIVSKMGVMPEQGGRSYQLSPRYLLTVVP